MLVWVIGMSVAIVELLLPILLLGVVNISGKGQQQSVRNMKQGCLSQIGSAILRFSFVVGVMSSGSVCCSCNMKLSKSSLLVIHVQGSLYK